MTNTKVLIGGQALRNIGHDRHTSDLDYLIYKKSDTRTFITGEKVDYINCAHNSFFKEIWFSMKVENGQADPQTLFDLKMFAAVQHFQNFKLAKADAAEYDLKFLNREFGCEPKTVKNYITAGELASVYYK